MLPDEPEAQGLLALMLLVDARREARVGAGRRGGAARGAGPRPSGTRERIAEGLALSERAAAAGPVGPYTVQARIAAAHATAASAEETDWARIARLYEWLARVAPGPVVELNRAAAVAMSEGPERGLELIGEIEGLDGLRAAARRPRRPAAPARARAARRRPAFERALELSSNPVERRFIERRIAELSAGSR